MNFMIEKQAVYQVQRMKAKNGPIPNNIKNVIVYKNVCIPTTTLNGTKLPGCPWNSGTGWPLYPKSQDILILKYLLTR